VRKVIRLRRGAGGAAAPGHEALGGAAEALGAQAAPDLVEDIAATLLVAAGDNPDRLRSDGSPRAPRQFHPSTDDPAASLQSA